MGSLRNTHPALATFADGAGKAITSPRPASMRIRGRASRPRHYRRDVTRADASVPLSGHCAISTCLIARTSAICPTTFNTIVTRYRRFDLALRAAYRASLAAFCSVCKASSRLAVSAKARSACASAARFASIASSASRAFLSAFSISRAFSAAVRSPASATRVVCRSAKPGSSAWARNFSSAAFFALVAAFRRSTKSGALDRRIYPTSQELIVRSTTCPGL
jgi:hypothetical protein